MFKRNYTVIENVLGAMFQAHILIIICVCATSSTLTSTSSLNILGGCLNKFNVLDSLLNQDKLIESPGFSEGKLYEPGTSCKWLIDSPNNTQVELICEVDIPEDKNCSTDEILVSTSGNLKFQDAAIRCGLSSFTLVSEYNKIAVSLQTKKESKGGKFSCKVRAVGKKRSRAVYTNNCNCGWSNRVRIVNGSPTGINEYTFMAGIVDADARAIVCGATLISRKHVITAAHCLRNLALENTSIILGEHDISTGLDTSATILVRVKSFNTYPYYDAPNKKYDLALIELVVPVTFNSRVGPACLPFTSANWDLTSQVVTVLGWGTTEYGGPRSKVLLQTNLNIVDIQECQSRLDEDNGNIDEYTQYCTLAQYTDACQYDSGGPLVWMNPNTNRFQIVGIISYGRGCAFGYPSVNTKMAPFLQWIIDNTSGENYCAL